MHVILASHLVFTGYGHWLSNDPRGSGSESLRENELAQLGDIHFGRKGIQPSKQELRDFYRRANALLDHPPIWFRKRHRDVIANAVARVCETRGYTCWAFAVCGNHAHGVFRAHKVRSEVIWQHIADSARDALRKEGLVPADHPVWSHRPYKVFLHTHEDVHGRIDYVEANPLKEGLSKQTWSFVKPCPFAKPRTSFLPRRASYSHAPRRNDR